MTHRVSKEEFLRLAEEDDKKGSLSKKDHGADMDQNEVSSKFKLPTLEDIPTHLNGKKLTEKHREELLLQAQVTAQRKELKNRAEKNLVNMVGKKPENAKVTNYQIESLLKGTQLDIPYFSQIREYLHTISNLSQAQEVVNNALRWLETNLSNPKYQNWHNESEYVRDLILLLHDISVAIGVPFREREIDREQLRNYYKKFLSPAPPHPAAAAPPVAVVPPPPIVIPPAPVAPVVQQAVQAQAAQAIQQVVQQAQAQVAQAPVQLVVTLDSSDPNKAKQIPTRDINDAIIETGWAVNRSRAKGVVLQDHKYGKVKFDHFYLCNHGILRYELIGRVGNPHMQVGDTYYFTKYLTKGLIYLFYTDEPKVGPNNKYPFNQDDLIYYQSFSKFVDNEPSPTSQKGRTLISLALRVQNFDTTVQNQFSLVSQLGSGLQESIKMPTGRMGNTVSVTSKRYQTTVEPDGRFGQSFVQIHPMIGAVQLQGGTILVPPKDVQPGLHHLLFCKRIGKNMREIIQPKDVQDYQSIVKTARPKLSPESQQYILANTPIIPLGVITGPSSDISERLRILCASADAGNKGGVFVNEAKALIDQLISRGQMSSDEGDKILKLYFG